MKRVVCINNTSNYLKENGILIGRSYELVQEHDRYWKINTGTVIIDVSKFFNEFILLSELRLKKLKKLETI